jgi:hypothetical protein
MMRDADTLRLLMEKVEESHTRANELAAGVVRTSPLPAGTQPPKLDPAKLAAWGDAVMAERQAIEALLAFVRAGDSAGDLA